MSSRDSFPTPSVSFCSNKLSFELVAGYSSIAAISSLSYPVVVVASLGSYSTGYTDTAEGITPPLYIDEELEGSTDVVAIGSTDVVATGSTEV